MSGYKGDAGRVIQLGEAVPTSVLDNTFEGQLLYAVLTDNHPMVQPSEDNERYLGENDLVGEGFLTFNASPDELAATIALAKTSGGRCAKSLLPLMEAGFERQLANPRDYASFELSQLEGLDGSDLSFRIADILQDILILYPDQLSEQHFTLIGHYTHGDPDHSGGFAYFITAEGVDYMGADEWLMEKRREFRQGLSTGPKM